MPELFVRSALANLGESQLLNDANEFSCLENREFRQVSAYLYQLHADKLPFKWRLAILKQHLDDFLEILIEFVKRFSLRVRTGKTGHVTDQQTRLRIALDYGGIRFHVKSLAELG